MAFRFPCPIYPIVGDIGSAMPPLELAEKILGCGIPLIQLRLKSAPTETFVALARELRILCDRHDAMMIVNDRCDVAKLVGADGVHLGQEDLSTAAARKILGPDAIIGHSTHDQAQLERAVVDPAIDYVAYGPVFETRSKSNPDPVRGLLRLHEAAARCPRPLVAIGGIDETNVAQVIRRGADSAAVISAIGNAADPGATTRRLLGAAASPVG